MINLQVILSDNLAIPITPRSLPFLNRPYFIVHISPQGTISIQKLIIKIYMIRIFLVSIAWKCLSADGGRIRDLAYRTAYCQGCGKGKTIDSTHGLSTEASASVPL